jgi:nicotinate-nucleotide--dimethylbenzimidazole phosphoribosyltransferase
MHAAQQRLDQLTKPPGSLGVLEDLAVRLAGISGNPLPRVKDKAVVVMAADHGVVEQGVSAFPSEVTAQMVLNFLRGGAAINVLARQAGARVTVVDIGVARSMHQPGLINRKVRLGTANIARCPAMTREEAVQALETGIEIATDEVGRGADILATGDMGIGNTTPSSAILACFSGLPARRVVGRGTGVDDRRLALKVAAVEAALRVNQPDPRDPIDVLSKVGGLEIGGLAGVILGAAANRRPVVIDGFISGAAALVAARIAPKAVNYMIASHLSQEPGHRLILEMLDLEPMLQMKMRLGEGTGAVLAFHLVEAATRILREMATFADAGVSGAVDG